MTFEQFCEHHHVNDEERLLALAYLMALRMLWAFRAMTAQRETAHTPPAPAAERGEGERVMKNLTDRRSAAQDGAVCGNCACGRNDYDARMDAIIWRERYNEILQAVGRVVLSASTSAREK